jgi:tellurium resistance protein TerD
MDQSQQPSVLSDQASDAFIELHKEDPGLRKLRVAIGWQAPEKVNGYDLDMDVSLLILNRENKVRSDEDFIFYNNLKSFEGSVVHNGDERKGFGEGDKEAIDIDLTGLPYDIEKMMFIISIHNANERFQSFKDLESGFIRIINFETHQEIGKFAMASAQSDAIAYALAILERRDNEWVFERLQTPHEEGLYGIVRDHGVHVAEP